MSAEVSWWRAGRMMMVTAVFGLAASMVVAAPALVGAGDADRPTWRVNFQSSGAQVPPGYLRDFGQGFDPARGYGWVDATGTPLSLVGNGRDRGARADQVLDTLITTRSDDGVDGTFEYAVSAGRYDVTVTVGDPAPDQARASAVEIEGELALTGFAPSPAEPHRQVTRTITVTDGSLSLGTAGHDSSFQSVEIVERELLFGTEADECANATADVARVDFTTETADLPGGYLRDFGQPFDSGRKYGWIEEASTNPLSLIGNGRERNSTPIQQDDTVMQFQYAGADGVQARGRWQYHLELEGFYKVTVGVGDPLVLNSRHTVNVEGIKAVKNFSPTPQQRAVTASVCVEVTDQELIIDGLGGDNTKLQWVVIQSAPPSFFQTLPVNGATNVNRCTGVTLVTTRGLDANTLSTETMPLRPAIGGAALPGNYNSDAAGGVAGFQPVNPAGPNLPALAKNTSYTLTTTTGVKDKNGVPFTPISISFTTANVDVTTCADAEFDRVEIDGNVTGPTAVTFGPDGKLYVGTSYGEIRRYNIGADGRPVGSPTSWYPFGQFSRIIIGMAFQPGSTSDNLRLWVSNNEFGFGNGIANFSGAVTLLTGTTNTALMPKPGSGIVGLPRSVKDHMTNSIEFGPDGKLYIAQGSQSGYGSPDDGWANREETPLSAAILVADVAGNATFDDGSPVNVNTTAGYNPATGPVQAYADGIRNPYDLVWTSSNRLFSGVNEAAAGDVPSGSANGQSWGEYVGVGSGNDFLSEILAGRYYGHPNPSIGKRILNGGNPTAAKDPWEFDGFVVETPPATCSGTCNDGYPVGVQPDPEWDAPLVDLGIHRSPNGIDEYDSGVFGGQLQGDLVVAEYSQGDRVIAVDPDTGEVKEIARGFFNPLDVRVDAASGRIYVAEFGSDPDGVGGKLSLLIPNPGATFQDIAKVNFNACPNSTPTPPDVPGYSEDCGAPYAATANPNDFGWVSVGTTTPRDLRGDGRYRAGAFDDERNPLQATLMHMQLAPAQGGHGPGDWQIEVANGTYDVTVSTGDAGPATNSTHFVRAEGTTVIAPYTPSGPKEFRVNTVRITVTDGFLTLSASPSGTNTKINYVEVTKVTAT